MPERTTAERRRPWLRGVSATLVLVGLGAYAWAQFGPDPTDEPHCAVAGADGETAMTLALPQAANAATIEAVASSRGLPERAVTIAIATAMQESSLRNLDYGDRDSLGLFQQRPSQGWGTPEEVTDPVFAAGAFYDRLVEIDGYESMALTVAAQEVQRSAFPDEYAKHEEEAALLAGALTGRDAAALSCVWSVGERAERAGGGARVGGPDEVHALMVREFGEGVRPLGGEGSVTVPLDEGEETSRGWELAHWAMAHSEELGIERITYGDHVWDARSAGEGWRENAEEGADGEVRLALL
ncbi:hypothetical protein [Streptomyces radicis]|uniref:ARB-07466-like C-terminal domain-containing protein n=1 Tax=Streptomyces radicis TaxID=1750517 RepID=A0A3A9WHX5_9ACTN|nr:hypothetical protein [Streptomyces radicis]RKN09044.1 hypothetical protein D7319_14035 [Streptomyces radicis]RKN22765.1 hypothetical protein D7318_14520 [Streptomyces radicis]